MAPRRSNKGKKNTESDDKSVFKVPGMSSTALKSSSIDKHKMGTDDKSVFKVPGMSSMSNKGKEEMKSDDMSIFKVPRISSMIPKTSNKGKEEIKSDNMSAFRVPGMSSTAPKRSNKDKDKTKSDDKSVFKVPSVSSMAPKTSNKGKEKMESVDKSIFKVPKMSSIGLRVGFSKKIEVHVNTRGVEDKFESLFKVSRRTFKHIHSLVRDDMMCEYTNFTFTDGSAMSLNDQIAIALTRLSSVDTSINIAIMYGTDDWTVDSVTWEFVEALEEHAVQHISWPLDISQMKSGFKRISGMPNCCGAIETTHIKMYLHKSEGETDVWLDRNNNNTMQLQVIVDPTMRFVDVVSGLPGRMTKDGVLQESKTFSLAQKGERFNGNGLELSERIKIPEYLVGDSGFQLLPWLITPYGNEELTDDQTEFNKKHLETRLVASRALKKLKEVWAVIDGGMWWPDRHKLPRIILACCILHNIRIENEEDGVSDESMTSFDHDPGYPPEKGTLPDDKIAAVVRDELCLYLAGKLPV